MIAIPRRCRPPGPSTDGACMSEPLPYPEIPGTPQAEDPNAAMLAELDALLERMMALPVSPAVGLTPPPRPEPPPDDVPIITVTEAGPQTYDAPPAVPVVSTAPDDLYF